MIARFSIWAFVTAAALSGAGCDRDTPKATPPAPAPFKRVESANDPKYIILPETRERDATSERYQVQRFVEQFLRTCIDGDYAAYRRFVSRTVTPQPQERFAKVYNAVKLVTVELIEPLSNPRLPDKTYRVVFKIEFLPGQQEKLRHNRDTVRDRAAILVFPEEGEWRMRPAPGELQPEEPTTQSTTDEAPTTEPAAEYPWEGDGG